MIYSLLFAIDSIHIHFRKFIFSIALIFICSLIVLFTLMAYHAQNAVYESCDRVLSSGVKGTGIIQIIDDFYNQKTSQFFHDLRQQKEIQAIGDCTSYIEQSAEMKPLRKIQQKQYASELEGVYIWEVMQSTLPICSIKLNSGTQPEELIFHSDNLYYLYLGYSFHNIPIGTTYQCDGNTYKVAGIICKGQEWIKEDLLTDFSYENATAAQSCDYMIFKIKDERPPLTDYCWLSAAPGYTIDDALDKANSLAQKRKIEIHYSSLQEQYEISQTSTITLLGYLYKIIWIVGSTSILMLISLQIVFILSNRKEYGVMLTAGFSQRDIFLSVLFYNIITAIIAICLVLPCLYAIAKYWFATSYEIDYIVKYIFLPHMLPAELLMVSIMLSVITIVTNGILHILTPVQMLYSK